MNIQDYMNRGRSRPGLGFQRPGGGQGGRIPPGTTAPAPSSPRAPYGRSKSGWPMPSPKQLRWRRLLDILPPYRYARAVNYGSKLAIKAAQYYFENPTQYASPQVIPEGYGPGWIKVCDTGNPNINRESWYLNASPGTFCGLSFQVPSNWQSGDNQVYRGRQPSGSPRMNFYQSWWHPLPGPAVQPAFMPSRTFPRPHWPTLPQPILPPWIRPAATPPLAPMPKPDFPPYRVIPYLPGAPHRNAGYGEAVGFTPAMPPYRVPAADPGGRTDPPFTSPGHNFVPPGRGVKEKKRPGRYPPGVDEAIGVAGEFIDYVEAAHSALPERYQNGDTPQEKLRDIYKHIDKMSWPKFIWNLGLNQAEDRAWGKVGSALGKASANKGGPTGLQTGPWDTSGGYYAGFY